MLLLVFWDGVTWVLGIKTFIVFKNFFYRGDNKRIQLFTFGRALLSVLEPHAACATAASSRPSWLYGFVLCQNDFAQVYVVNRAMQRSHRWVFLFFLFLLASSSKGFAAWVDPLLCADLADWWRSSDNLVFLVLVISFTLRPESFLSIPEALTEINEFREDLCSTVNLLDNELFLTLLRESNIYQLKDLVVW